MTPQTVAEIILLILGFTILIFYISKIYLAYDPSDTACKQSVALRGALPSIGQGIVPLRCKTNKYCFVGDGSGNCYGTWGESPDISKIKVSSLLQIEKFLSDKFKSCYDDMGQGKINLFSQAVASNFGFKDVFSSCVVCSRFAFDINSLNRAKIYSEHLANLNVLQYMASHKVPNTDVSYLTYFAGGEGKINVQPDLNIEEVAANLQIAKDKLPPEDTETEVLQSAIDDLKNQNSPETDRAEQNSEMAIVFMQISAPGMDEVLRNDLGAAGVVGVSAIAFRPVGWLGKLTVKACKSSALAAGVCALVVMGVAVYQMGTVYNNQNIAASYCGDFGVGDDVRFGCSGVKLVNYDEQGIRDLCVNVESY